ncbi:hypothetical protein ACOYR1_14105 [Thalassotalea piscium]
MTTSINNTSQLYHITGHEQVAYEGWSIVNNETSALSSILVDHEKHLVLEAPDALVEDGISSIVISADDEAQFISFSQNDCGDGYIANIFDLSESHMFIEQTLPNALRTLDAIDLLLESINSGRDNNSMFFYIRAFKNFRQPINQLAKDAINLHCVDKEDIGHIIEEITDLMVDEVRDFWKIISYEFKRDLNGTFNQLAKSGGCHGQ